MQSRDVTIPLALWMCAAICAHFLFGTGGLVVAKMHDDRSELWKLSREASNLAQRDEQTFELSLGEVSDEKDAEHLLPPPKPPEPKPLPTATPAPTAVKAPIQPRQEPTRVVVLEKKDAEKKQLVLPEDPLKDRRIAVRQHAEADQKDNPEAKFVADEANHVEKETVATQTSHDRDDQQPTPGGNHPGSDKAPGDSEKTRIAESAEHPGLKDRAPGEKATHVEAVAEPKLPQPTSAGTSQPAAHEPAPRGDMRPVSAAQAAQPQIAPQALPGGTTPASPEVQTSPGGDWVFNPTRAGGAAGSTQLPNAGASSPTLPGGKLWSLPGLGQSPVSGTMNTNLNPSQIAAVVGSDNLRRLREADGERRKSEHRGSWASSGFERWRSAIENYVSSVKPGNQTALNTAQVPFASYLNGMHNRIHPIFADSFLGSLDSLPVNHPMNDQHLVTRLEIVLTKEGHLKKMGIVKTSGITAFDIAALDAVDRAQPFGPAPIAIVSPDGNVYLHWEFHRDEVYACSTMGARPFILNTPGPKNEDPLQPPGPSPGSPGKERGAPPSSPTDSREGTLRRGLGPQVWSANARPAA